MVKLASQSEAKRSHLKLERQLSCHHQQQDTRTKGGGGGDLKKKMKKVRSIRLSSSLDSLKVEESLMKQRKAAPIIASPPNYMKPTSSWDARKEQLQVTVQSHTTNNKKPGQRNLKNLNSSEPSKALIRKSSLRPVRPLMKKNSKTGLVNRATCSSTLKDSKFPKALDLSPGATEAEGTSVMNVCPYTYCSLNGHRHEPLPPLKCFVSTRRKLIKTQKSMKLRGLSPLRGEGLGKGDKEIDSGQTDEFFVEIYTSKPHEHTIELETSDEKSNKREETKAESEVRCELAKEDELMNESDISFEDDTDQSSMQSDEEMDVMMGFLEYVECDPQMEEAQKEKLSRFVPEDYAEWCYGCCLVDASSKNGEGITEGENKVTDMEWEEEASQIPDNKSEYSDDGFGPIFSSHDLSDSVAGDAEVNAEVLQEVEEVTGYDNIMASDDGNYEGNGADLDDRGEMSTMVASVVNFKPQEPGPLGEKEQADPSVAQGYDSLSSNQENILCKDEVCEKPKDSETEHDEGSNLEPYDLEGQQSLEYESIDEAENKNAVVDDTSSLLTAQISDSLEEFTGIDKDISPIQKESETTVDKCNDAAEDESISCEVSNCPSNNKSDESNTNNWRKSMKEQLDDNREPNTRMRIIRKRTTEEPEHMKEFNPRAPRFLELEPNPDDEKVDLRHQLIDERKNAEEWMIDYALQRAVNALAPARKRKVALLVEAFETVMPLPMCEKPLRHSAPGFANARPIQACS